ncbi:type II secretion system protein GspM [Sphingobium subterraneum]|uniref:General secretion pathway protein M n=1 Tax=Sphingobium subterraneum TaxID=627688 RepID=A0A841IVL2_9SPHN|nr:type II secretion system protein M [Sphingobium subterraneum]MBB6122697.1 general secretion pathway protein M [Sphingobium subterraneum]
MIDSLTLWWNQRAPRERWLLSIMGVLLAGLILWLGVYRPVSAALASAYTQHDEAVVRFGAVGAKVKALQAVRGGGPAPSRAPIAQIVGQSAGEAGFTLEQIAPQGPGRLSLTIATARPPALFSWIAQLERKGVVVDTIRITPSGVTGTVSVQAVFMTPGAGSGAGT